MTSCRSMHAAYRPVVESRTYQAATSIDPEPHVLSITIHAPTYPLDFSTPHSIMWSLVPGVLADYWNTKYTERTGRTRAIHFVGHATVELKSVDPNTGQIRYLLASVTDGGHRETYDKILHEQVGFAIVESGTKGQLESSEKIARDIDESAELGIRAVRLRVILSETAAKRMFEFYEDFVSRRIYEKFALAAYPLDGDGAGCTSLVASFLDVAGLLEPDWQAAWMVHLRVPRSLIGDPNLGIHVPPRHLLFGPRTRRWAAESEPYKLISFYDTSRIYDWILCRHQQPLLELPPGYSTHSNIERILESHLGMPVVTIDRRETLTPTGPLRRITPQQTP